MNILLIDPPFQRFMAFYRFYYPLGLASMAAVLRNEGHSVAVYDADHAQETDTLPWSQAAEKFDDYLVALANDAHPFWTEIRDTLVRISPQVVGITMLSVKASSAAKVARISKDVNQKALVVVGADHPSVLPELVLRDPNIDIVVRGEGEQTFRDLITCLNSAGPNRRLEEVAGISFRKGNEIVHNPERPLIDDLDALPYPAIDSILNWDSYRPVDLGALLASRGCPYSCTFCGIHNVWSRRVRFRSTENIVGEMKWLHSTYGTDYFSFRDPCYTLRRKRILGFCEYIISQGLPVEWECLTRVDLLDEDMIRLMRRAGCATIRLGIESADPEVLRSMRKEVDLDRIRMVSKLLNEQEFYWSAYFLFGTPLETKSSIWRTVDFIQEIKPPFVTISRYAPIAGTDMCRELQEQGRLPADVNWAHENNQQFSSSYVAAMDPAEFEMIMREVTVVLEEHNRMQSVLLRRMDRRLKAVEDWTIGSRSGRAED